MKETEAVRPESQPATEKTPFEAFVSAILKVPKGEIVEAEGKRPKRPHPKR